MKKIIISVAFLFVCHLISAQYTPIINSKRPGFSESPYGVGTKVFQVETGAFYEQSKINELFYADNSFGANLFLRYGRFIEKLEVNLDVAYQQDERSFHNVLITNPTTVNGLSRLTLGAKYLIYNSKYTDKSKEVRSWKKRMAFDWKRLIPSVGVYAGWNSNFLSDGFKEDKMSLKGAVLLQNDFNDRFVLLTNLIVDRILLSDMEYSYILTATYALNEKWSMFGEHQGNFRKNKNNKFQFGAGTAYLISKNIQLDVAARTTMVSQGTINYVSLGGSWRLDRHKGKKKANGELEGTKEPFFKRIFKKRKKKRKVKKVKHKKRRKSKKSKKGTPSFFKKKKKKKKK
ncbi:MAG: transporter [Flavobacteriaceae bacterium]